MKQKLIEKVAENLLKWRILRNMAKADRQFFEPARRPFKWVTKNVGKGIREVNGTIKPGERVGLPVLDKPIEAVGRWMEEKGPKHIDNMVRSGIQHPEAQLLAIGIPGFNELGGVKAYSYGKRDLINAVSDEIKKRRAIRPNFKNGPFSTLKF